MEQKMRHIFAVENAEQLLVYQEFVTEIQGELDAYLDYLREHYEVKELPRAIVWTSTEIATQTISDIPLPAYTNDFRTVMMPELDVWRQIFLRQFEGLDGAEPQIAEMMEYYRTTLSRNKVLQILGHEFAHHSGWFVECDYIDGVWFEEGMVEYISRKYFLTEEEFAAEKRVNRWLVEHLTPKYGGRSLEQFGSDTYKGDFASIFFEYWRSFLAVKGLVDRHDGDVEAVFARYWQWAERGSGQTLSQWFGLEDA